MRGFGIDIREAFHTLIREPWSNAAIVLTLSLGIGATTGGYAIFNYLLFRPVPGVQNADGLLTIRFQSRDDAHRLGYAPLDAMQVLRQVPGIEALGKGHSSELPLTTRPGADPEFAQTEFVSGGYLDLLQVRTRLGRLISPGEADTPGHHVALISDAFWKRAFGGRNDVIGQRLMINAAPFEIVGVIDRYRGWGASRVGTVDVWLPAAAETIATKRPASRTVSILVARRRHGVSTAVIAQQARQTYDTFAATLSGREAEFVPWVYDGLDAFQSESFRTRTAAVFPFVLGGSALLLLMACANVANLLLARTIRRQRELAIRQAIGAGRWRLVRSVLSEAVLLAGLSTIGGLLMTWWASGLLRGSRVLSWGPELANVPIDWRVVAFAIGAATATVCACSVVPALSASRVDLRRLIQDTRGSLRGRRWMRNGVACLQIAASLTLMAGAGVMTRSLANMRAVDLGAQIDGVTSLRIDPVRLGYSAVQRDALIRRALEQLNSSPGVHAVAFTSPSLADTSRLGTSMRSADSLEGPLIAADGVSISPGYFDVLRIPLQAGRTFIDSEFKIGPAPRSGTAVISASLAKQLFGAQPAVGRRLAIAARPSERVVDIIGVVSDTKSGRDVLGDSRPIIYEPGHAVLNYGTIYFRSSLPPADAITLARQVMRETDPALPLTQVTSLREQIDRLFVAERTLTRLISFVGLLATLLALAGIYAVCLHAVAERTREFGIRLALGATRTSVAAIVVRNVAMICLVGTLSGVTLFVFASRMVSINLYGVAPLDPLSVGAAVLLVTLTAFAAAWLPSARATRVDPVLALRTE